MARGGQNLLAVEIFLQHHPVSTRTGETILVITTAITGGGTAAEGSGASTIAFIISCGSSQTQSTNRTTHG